MKQLSAFFLCVLMLTSCKTEQKQDGYSIEGKASGVYNGVRAYLKAPGTRGRAIPIDTAIIINEAFSFKGKITNPGLYHFTIDNVRGKLPLVLDNESITIDANKDNIAKSIVEGSEATSIYEAFGELMREKSQSLRTLSTDYRTAITSNDQAKAAAIQEKIKEENANIEIEGLEFIKKHSNSITALVLLESASQNRDLNTDKFVETFNALDESIKTSPKAKQLFTIVQTMIDSKKRDEALNIGKKAPEFSAPDTNGKTVELKDVLGKVTIIDFWASWCGPCRRENPNVVKLYEKYHDKGLEIVGISLDRAHQKDRWIQAIADDQLTWHHVSNLNYFNGPVAKLYNISSIPATYILDENGTIIAKNLRGFALEQKMAELLGS